MSSHAGHVTTETVYGQTLALRLGDGDEHRALESDTTQLNVKGNLYLYGDIQSMRRYEILLRMGQPLRTFD